jgi:hypothetical protein
MNQSKRNLRLGALVQILIMFPLMTKDIQQPTSIETWFKNNNQQKQKHCLKT